MPSAFVNSEAKVARVLLADDHAEILSRTASALADEFEIVGSVANVVDLVKAAAQFDPDVVVLDITMPGFGWHRSSPAPEAVRVPRKVDFPDHA